MKLVSRITPSTRTDRLLITESFQIVHEFVRSAVGNIKWRYREFDPAGMGQAQWLIQADYVAVDGSYGLGNRALASDGVASRGCSGILRSSG
jgi:hypothetical protein